MVYNYTYTFPINIHGVSLPLSYSSFSQACTALSPDDQLTILRDKWIKENNDRVMSEKDNEIIQYYLNEVSHDLRVIDVLRCDILLLNVNMSKVLYN